MSDIREAAKTALQQWKMYAEFEERDLASENSPEGDMFRTVRAALADDGWRDISTAPVNESILIYVPDYDHYGPGILRAILVDMGTGKHWHTTGYAIGRDLPPPHAGHLQPTRWRPLPTPPEPKS